jgi:pimeloyl-ACP methyl ester carboxylesterase
MITEQTFETGSVAINWGEGPRRGPPLVLLHGISMWWRTFMPVLPYLSERFHVHAVDFRGHGRSGRVPGGYRLEEYVRDTAEFLKRVVGEPAYIAGHSLGGLVAIQLGAVARELVRAMVLEDPPLYDYRGERLKMRPSYKVFVGWLSRARQQLPMAELESRLSELEPELDATALRLRAESLRLLDPDVLAMYIDGAATENYETDPYLPQIVCPVLLLRGDPALGGAIDDVDEVRAKSLLKRCTVRRVPGVGHRIKPYQLELYQTLVADYFGATVA